MILFPPAKINIGLNILRKRNDGFHEIASLMTPIGLCDIMEIVPSDHFSFRLSGIAIDGNEEDNLCIKAHRKLQSKRSFPEAQIHLMKIIPFGAGLGGGSSDAAYVMKGLNELFELGFTNEELKDFLSELGSDCPFFVDECSQYAEGRGEILSQMPIDLSSYYIKLINPGIHIGTAEAYSAVLPNANRQELKEVLDQPISMWKDSIENDFERSVFPLYPS